MVTVSPLDQALQLLTRHETLGAMSFDYYYVIRVDEDQRLHCEWMSPSFQRITGDTSCSQAVDSLWFNRIYPEDQERAKNTFQTALSGLPTSQEFRIVMHNGDICWLQERTWPVVEAGQPMRILVVARDITEQRKTEQALADAQQQLQLILTNTTDIIFLFDMDHRLQALYGAVHTLSFNAPAAELVRTHTPLEQLLLDIHPLDREQVMRCFATAFAGQTPAEVEYRIVTSSASNSWYSSTCSPLFDQQGIQIGVQGRCRDINLRKRVIKERQLLERKLQDMQKLESLGVLAGGIAHDFNNILQAIYGNVTLAQAETPPNTQAAASLAQIEAAAQRASDLVQQLLAYASKGPLDLQLFDVQATIKDIASTIRSTLPPSITFEDQVTLTSALIRGDIAQFRRAITNLVTNAIDAISTNTTGKISINVGVETLTSEKVQHILAEENIAPGSYISIAVSDNGVGIEEATLARIFEPFFSTKFTGRGLGLAAVLGIMRTHHGGVLAESQPDAGTTITLFFPLAQRSEVIAPPVVQAGSFVGTILVVDDEDAVRDVVSRVLERAGFTVISAGDGPQALALFEQERDQISVVLLDMLLPGMSGEQIYERIRQQDAVIPVVLISGFSQRELSSRLKGGVSTYFLQKPFSAVDLRRKLREVLGLEG